MEKIRFTTVEEIKQHLRAGDYLLISQILGGKPTKRTVESQLNGQRTLKENVRTAAVKLIESREELLNTNLAK
jgi:hypothetical protein